VKPEKIRYQDIEDKFPQLLKCGLEVNEGWLPLIWDMCEQLLTSRETLNLPISEENPLYFVQIKEKFGNLRVYAAMSTEEDEKIISMFEDMSQFVCSMCSKPGQIRGQHWLYAACEAHTNPSDK
jgi:hypothetical protein